jgi:hypothetical protein
MDLSTREFWAIIHGFILGGGFLLAFAGGIAEFWSLRFATAPVEEIRQRVKRLTIGTTGMAVVAWTTVITGTWIVYPWYREDVPDSPRSLLLSSPDTEDWHNFAFEWKEHVAWIAPMLATAAAAIVIYKGRDLAKDSSLRKLAMGLFVLAFVTAAIAGILGALVTKKAPVL